MRQSLGAIGDFLFLVFAFVAIPSLIYGWWFYLKTVRHQAGWRTGASLMVIIVITVCLLLFPVAIALRPPVGSDYNASMGAVAAYYEKWHQVVIKVLGACFLLSFFAKGRLILAVAVASIGVGCFWIAMTIT